MSAGNARLLPKTGEEFSDKEFWDGFFKKRGSKAFEWYGEYTDLVHLWAQYVRKGDSVLNIGCGNSELGVQLYDRQACSLVANIDTSASVVQQMAKRFTNSNRPKLTFEVMDASKMTYTDAAFNCVIDKGTLDAMMSSADNEPTVDAMLSEVQRVLMQNGRYIVITLCQKNVIDKLIQNLSNYPWIVRVHQIEQTGDSAFPLPVFFIVFTKIKIKMPEPIVEVADGVSPPTRIANALTSLGQWLYNTQLASYSIKRQCQQAESEFTYQCSVTGLPVLQCALLTSRRAGNGYAVFIAPLLSLGFSREQRMDILRQQRRKRMLFVKLHPWLYYADGDNGIKSLLSSIVMRFTPDASLNESEVPFLSTGTIYPYEIANSNDKNNDDINAKKSNNSNTLLVEQEMNNTNSVRLISPKATLMHTLCYSRALVDGECDNDADDNDDDDTTVSNVLSQCIKQLSVNNSVSTNSNGRSLCLGCPYNANLISKFTHLTLVPAWHTTIGSHELAQFTMVKQKFAQMISTVSQVDNSESTAPSDKYNLVALFPNTTDLAVSQQWLSDTALLGAMQHCKHYLLLSVRNHASLQSRLKQLQQQKLPAAGAADLAANLNTLHYCTIGAAYQQHTIMIYSDASSSAKLDELLCQLAKQFNCNFHTVQLT